MDETLFGGFLSAIQMYSQKVSGKNVKELSLDEYRVVIAESKGLFLVTVHDTGDQEFLQSSARVRKVLEEVPSEIVTDDTLEAMRKAADMADGKINTPTDWASKML